MHFFYVLYSLKDNKLYKGYSENVGKRFTAHYNGEVKSTMYRRPLVLIYSEIFDNKDDALNRERWSKSKNGGPELKQILVDKGVLVIKENGFELNRTD